MKTNFVDHGGKLIDGRGGQIAVHDRIAENRVLRQRFTAFFDEVTGFIFQYIGKSRGRLQRTGCCVLDDKDLRFGLVEEIVNDLFVFIEPVHLREFVGL